MPLITGWSVPHPHARTPCAGEEIVHSRRKHRGRVNPLVVGSNPTGPKPTPSQAFSRSEGFLRNLLPGPSTLGQRLRADFAAFITASLQAGVTLSILLCRHATAVLSLSPGQSLGVSPLQASVTDLSAASQLGGWDAGAGV